MSKQREAKKLRKIGRQLWKKHYKEELDKIENHLSGKLAEYYASKKELYFDLFIAVGFAVMMLVLVVIIGSK